MGRAHRRHRRRREDRSADGLDDPDGDPPPSGPGGGPGGGAPDPVADSDPPDPGLVTDGTEIGTPVTSPGGGGEQTLATGATFPAALLRLADPGRGPEGRRSPARGEHGATVGDRRPAGRVGDLAVTATLRAAAPHQRARGRLTGGGLALRGDDLREKVREGREGNLVLFVVDASGSMAARRRMSAVKGAVVSLLLDAYQRRDRIGVVTFRGDTAEVALPPTPSTELAVRLLERLPTGGRTPIAAGLERAATVLAAEAVRDPRRRPLLVVLTDGRTTSGPDPRAAAGALAARGVRAVVVDTEDGAVRLGLAATLADALAAPCVRLEALAAGSLAGVVRDLTGRRAA